MSETRMMLVNLRGGDTPLTLADVKHRYSLADHEVDDRFGVIEVDDVEHIYTVRVTEPAAMRIDARFRKTGDVEGAYGDVPIQPFGPPV